MPPTVDGFIEDVFALPNGEFLAAGRFEFPGGSDYVARWTGSAWQPVGAGLPSTATHVVMLPNGEVVCSGLFGASRLMKFDGTSWAPFGVGLPIGSVSGLAVLPNGDLVVAGYNVFRWDGQTWYQYPPGFPFSTRGLAVRPNGNIVVIGSSHSTGYSVAEWDGASWIPYGTGPSGGPWGVTALPNGDVVVVGSFLVVEGIPAYYCARWDGQQWHAMSTGLPGQSSHCTTLPNGDVVASIHWSQTSSGIPIYWLFRWNGQSWLPLGIAGQPIEVFGTVYDVEPPSHGSLAIAGSFDAVSGGVSRNLAMLASTCAPSAATAGLGCAGGGGVVDLVSENLPWLDSTFRARCSGLPANAIALGAYGFSQSSVPIAALLPQGLPGCVLYVADTILFDALIGSPQVVTTIAIPNDPMLVGSNFFHQVVPAELDGLGNIAAISASNALALTIGTF